MTVNVPLLRKALEHITAHPEEHEQDVWAITTPCGTRMCLAGHVLAMSGERFLWKTPTSVEALRYLAVRSADRTADGAEIPEVAAEVLGLSRDEAGALFFAESLNQLWAVAEEITDGEIRDPRP